MNPVLCGISIFVGFSAGTFAAARVSSGLKYLDDLCCALETLHDCICTYSSGLGEAISSGNIDTKCVLFDDIAKNLTSGKPNFADIINSSPYNPEIKSHLTRLFETIIHGEESEIIKSFDITLSTVKKYRDAERIKKEKNAPLYKKAGLLLGIGAAILFL